MNVVLRTNSEDCELSFNDIERFFDNSGYHARMQVRSHGFSGQGDFYFDSHSMNLFIKQLTEMNITLSGVARIAPEFDLYGHLEIAMGRHGQVNVRGELALSFPPVQRLAYEFVTDQTVLKPLLADMKRWREISTVM